MYCISSQPCSIFECALNEVKFVAGLVIQKRCLEKLSVPAKGAQHCYLQHSTFSCHNFKS